MRIWTSPPSLVTLTVSPSLMASLAGEKSHAECPGERGVVRVTLPPTFTQVPGPNARLNVTGSHSSRRITCSTASAMGKAAVSTTALTANTKTRVTVRIRFSLILSFRFFEGPGDTEIVASLIHLGCQEIMLRPSWLQPPHGGERRADAVHAYRVSQTCRRPHSLTSRDLG